MKIISLFFYLVSFSSLLFSASSSSSASESKLPSSFLDKNVASRLKAYSAFHAVTQKNSRLERLEMAEALFDEDTRACTEFMKKYAQVRRELQTAGIETSGNVEFTRVEDAIDLNRRAVRMSKALLLDVICSKNPGASSRTEPSDQELQNGVLELIARPFTPESELFVEAFWDHEKSREIQEGVYNISPIHPLPRKEPGCKIM